MENEEPIQTSIDILANGNGRHTVRDLLLAPLR